MHNHKHLDIIPALPRLTTLLPGSVRAAQVGCGTKVGAGSVVVTDLPCHAVAVGVPARIIKRDVCQEPALDMDQTQDYILDFQI